MSDIYEPRKVSDFQEAILYNPIVHEYMRRALYDDMNYIEALKLTIVALVNQNEELSHKLASEIAGRPSRLIVDYR